MQNRIFGLSITLGACSTVSERERGRISHMIVQHSLTDNPNRHLKSCFRRFGGLKCQFTLVSNRPRSYTLSTLQVHRLAVSPGIRTNNVLYALFLFLPTMLNLDPNCNSPVETLMSSLAETISELSNNPSKFRQECPWIHHFLQTSK